MAVGESQTLHLLQQLFVWRHKVYSILPLTDTLIAIPTPPYICEPLHTPTANCQRLQRQRSRSQPHARKSWAVNRLVVSIRFAHAPKLVRFSHLLFKISTIQCRTNVVPALFSLRTTQITASFIGLHLESLSSGAWLHIQYSFYIVLKCILYIFVYFQFSVAYLIILIRLFLVRVSCFSLLLFCVYQSG